MERCKYAVIRSLYSESSVISSTLKIDANMVDIQSVFSILSSSQKQKKGSATESPFVLPHALSKPNGKIETHQFTNNIARDDDVISSPQIPGALPAESDSTLPVDTLPRLLAKAAGSNAGIVTYAPHSDVNSPIRTSYGSLFEAAKDKARLIHHINGITPLSIILVHFDSHTDNIVWFWAVSLAGYLPAISTPLANDTMQRKRHLSHLHGLLEDPIVLTSNRLLPDFLDDCELRLQPVESLSSSPAPEKVIPEFDSKRSDDLAVLMLTSGSTGNAKAVGLRHRQILTSIRAKSKYHNVGTGDTFLNWIGM